MIHDNENKFNDAQVVTATGVSTDHIDLDEDRNLGIGEPMSVVILIDSDAIVNDADETYQFDLETDDNSAFSSPSVVVGRAFTNAEAVLELVNGKEAIVLAIPADLRCERFLRIAHTLGGTTPGVTYTAFLQPTHGVDAEVRGGFPNNSTITA